MAYGPVNVPGAHATTSRWGITMLNSSTSNTSTTVAATPSAVNSAYSKATSASTLATSANSLATTANTRASSAYTKANDAYNAANNASDDAASAHDLAQAAYDLAAAAGSGGEGWTPVDATATVKGITMLNSSTSNTSTTVAATPYAVNAVHDLTLEAACTAISAKELAQAAYDTALGAAGGEGWTPVDATTTVKGITMLNSSTSNTSTTVAATPYAVNAAYNLAQSAYDLASAAGSGGEGWTPVDATATVKGITMLNSSTSNTSTTVAATPNAVNATYKFAGDAYNTANNAYNAANNASTTANRLADFVNAYGSTAAYANSTGGTAFGYSSNAAGIYSLALGYNAVASKNDSTAVGYDSIAGYTSVAVGTYSNASGDESVAIGFDARSAGCNSVAIGTYSNATGFASVALGFYSNASGHNSVAIGYGAKPSGTNTTALGHYSAVSGNNSTALGIQAVTSNDESIQLGNASSLSSITAKVDITVTSDERDKTDIEPIADGATEFLRKVRAVTFVYNQRELYRPQELTEEDRENISKYGFCRYDTEAHAAGEKKGTRRRAGVIAQETQKAMQEVYGDSSYANLVNDNLYDFENVPDDIESTLAMNYSGFVPFLIKAVQELDSRITALEGT